MSQSKLFAVSLQISLVSLAWLIGAGIYYHFRLMRANTCKHLATHADLCIVLLHASHAIHCT